MENKITMEELTNYCKNYGYIFQGSEIYGGLANTWDFGPLGAILKNNIKMAWTKKFIQEDVNNVALDSAILMNPKTWEASGHLKTFSDPLIDCKHCKTRHRADKLLEDLGVEEAGKFSNEELINYYSLMGYDVSIVDATQENDLLKTINLMQETYFQIYCSSDRTSLPQ